MGGDPWVCRSICPLRGHSCGCEGRRDTSKPGVLRLLRWALESAGLVHLAWCPFGAARSLSSLVARASTLRASVSRRWLRPRSVGVPKTNRGHVHRCPVTLVGSLASGVCWCEDLALRYNDKSPLENMHSAKMFELLGTPKCNVFGVLSRPQFFEARKVCIEALLASAQHSASHGRARACCLHPAIRPCVAVLSQRSSLACSASLRFLVV